MILTKKLTGAALTAVMAAGLSLSAAGTASAAKVLTAPEADWTGGQVTCKIIQHILED